MSEEEKPLESGFSKCEACEEVKYLSGSPVCDSCREKRKVLGETGDQFCPMIREACKGTACKWWLEDDDCCIRLIVRILTARIEILNIHHD